MAFPTISVGQRVTALLLQQMMPQVIVKNAAQSVVSSTVLVSDNDLTVAVEANAQYIIEAVVRYVAVAAGDIQTSWLVPAGSAGNRAVTGPATDINIYGSSATTTTTSQTNADNSLSRWGVHGFATVVGYNGIRNSTTNQSQFQETLVISVGATAGNVTMQFSQGTSNASATAVSAGSYLRVTRVM